jgi:hypothetical protein
LKRLHDEAADEDRAASELVKKTLDLLRELESTQAQTRAAAIHRA